MFSYIVVSLLLRLAANGWWVVLCLAIAGESSIQLIKDSIVDSCFAALNDARFTWSGQLPLRNATMTQVSCKVFLGGVPWDLTEKKLEQIFTKFGQIRVEWPSGRDGSKPAGIFKLAS